ncbi:MAG: hypothetical protein NTX87_21000 [Planctomycetota bacterium]|nr:hypothetical protein [Planctomycetota bacterium]
MAKGARPAILVLVWAVVSAAAIVGAPATAATPPAASSAAAASPQDLLARVKADALKGKLTDGLITEFKDFAAAMAKQ